MQQTPLMAERLHLCLVAHFAYGALIGGDNGHIGGVERQTSLMARWLAARGHRVDIVTWDEGQPDGVVQDGVTIYRLCRQKAGLPGVRFVHPRWTSLLSALRRANADVYYHNCGECVTGQVALWCRRHGKRFVYSVASDPDCERQLPEIRRLRDRVLYRYGLRHTDRIIVQTRRQQQMLQTHFALDATVLPMPCPGPSKYDDVDGERHDSQRMLWIGRICEVKRPDRLLDLAQACPDLTFDLVGPTDDTEYARGICARAQSISNVVLHGPVCRAAVSGFYKRARLLCCTSDIEGFPNTFLEAWSYGLPVVSTFDPDHLIAEKGLGMVGLRVSELASGIRALLGSSEQWQQASRTARTYYLENHALDVAMERFEQTFCEVAPMKRISDGG